MRAMFNRDIATGKVLLFDEYTSVGPSNTWHIKNERLPPPAPRCYILDPATCTEEQWAMVRNNTARVRNYIVAGSTDDASSVLSDGWRNLPDEFDQWIMDSDGL